MELGYDAYRLRDSWKKDNDTNKLSRDTDRQPDIFYAVEEDEEEEGEEAVDVWHILVLSLFQ